VAAEEAIHDKDKSSHRPIGGNNDDDSGETPVAALANSDGDSGGSSDGDFGGSSNEDSGVKEAVGRRLENTNEQWVHQKKLNL